VESPGYVLRVGDRTHQTEGNLIHRREGAKSCADALNASVLSCTWGRLLRAVTSGTTVGSPTAATDLRSSVALTKQTVEIGFDTQCPEVGVELEASLV
jgi:hypothetical protein